MPKRKGKITSDTESLPPPLLRSLRSKNREHPYEEVCPSADICTTPPQQDTVINATTTSASSLQILESSLQGCTKTTQPEEEHTITSKQESDVEDKSSMAVSVCAKNIIADTVGGTVPTSPYKDFQLKNLTVVIIRSSHDNEGEGKEGKQSMKSPTHSPTNQSQPYQPASQGGEIGDAACPNVCEERQCTGESVDHRMEKSQDSDPVPNRLCIGGDERAAAVGLPAKKRRRMGTCGLTEKERSHFLEAQNRENTKSCREGGDQVEMTVRDGGDRQWTVTLNKDDPCQGCDNETDLVTEDRILSSSAPPSVGRVTEHWEMETKQPSGYCSGEDRADTDIHVSMTTSDMISNALNQAGGAVSCAEGESYWADPSTEPGPGLVIDNIKNGPSAESEGGLAIPVIGEEQELEDATDETVIEKCKKQRKETDDGCGGPDCYSAITLITATSQTAGIETGDQEGDQPLSPQRESVARDASMEAAGAEAVPPDADRDGDGAEARVPSTETGIGGFSGGTEEPYEVAATPSGPEENEKSPQTRTTPSPFGSWSLSYISDSQLNNTVIEKEVVERDAGPGSLDCHEDATEVVCGMIKELSALNWIVMVAHDELENFDCDPCSD